MKTPNSVIKPIWLLLLFVAVVSFANGQTNPNPPQQNVMIVNTLSGEKTTFNLKTLHSISFDNGHVSIVKKDATHYSYVDANIKYIDFGLQDLTAVNEVKSKFAQNQVLITPNPVLDNLNLLMESSRDEVVIVQILDLQGRVLLQQNMAFIAGQNTKTIPVTNLHSGFYLCRLLKGSESLITKFLKN